MDKPTDSAQARIERLEPGKLARLLSMDAATESWKGEDATVILRHQLHAALLPDLLLVPGAEETRLRALLRDRPGADSFLEQLTVLHPSTELLRAIKNFARHVCNDADNPLCGSPANILYFAAIAAGLARCNARITTLADPDLRAGFSWALQQPAAAPLSALFHAALEKLPPTDSQELRTEN